MHWELTEIKFTENKVFLRIDILNMDISAAITQNSFTEFETWIHKVQEE